MANEGLQKRSQLLEILERFNDISIGVVGDYAVDWIEIGRGVKISEEACHVVLEEDSVIKYPGAAANTAYSLMHLGCDVYPVGIIGTDDAGSFLKESFQAANCNHIDALLEVDPSIRQTHRYRKFFGTGAAPHSQQHPVLRLDTKKQGALEGFLEAHYRQAIWNLRGHVDAIIVCDYSKGCVTPNVLHTINALQGEIPIVVGDSRRNLDIMIDFTVVVPNEKELYYSLKKSDAPNGVYEDIALMEAAESLLHHARPKAIVMTRGEHGMRIYRKHIGHETIETLDIPTIPRKVFDVTGAGDTATAVLTAGLACCASLENACMLANAAAGVVVQKTGTATCSREELVKGIDESIIAFP